MKTLLSIITAITLSMVLTGCGPQVGEKPLTIPIKMLEPWWANWKAKDFSGELGFTCNKQDNQTSYGVNLKGMDSVSFDSNGNPIPPTKDGSIIFFETHGLKYEWVGKFTFQTDDRLSFKVVAGKGLVYVSGKGVCILPSGKAIALD